METKAKKKKNQSHNHEHYQMNFYCRKKPRRSYLTDFKWRLFLVFRCYQVQHKKGLHYLRPKDDKVNDGPQEKRNLP